MTLFDIRTVKESALYGAGIRWLNRWHVSAPFGVSDGSFRSLAGYVMELERQIHMSHVHYLYATIEDALQPGTTTLDQALTYVPRGGSAYGFQETPANPSTLKQGLHIQKFVATGKMGKWFFYGCINQDLIMPNRFGHVSLTNETTYNNVVATWLDGLMNNFGATLIVPSGLYQYNFVTAQNVCNMLLCGGMTLKNASTRKQAANQSPGVGIWAALPDKLLELATWIDQLGDWIEFNADFVPVAARDTAPTMLGDVKAICATIEKYCDGAQQSDGTTGQAPLFRWPPDADAIKGICEIVKSSIPQDIDDIERISDTPEPDGTPAIAHSDLLDIIAKYQKYNGWLSELNKADWLNPANPPGQ